MKDTQDKFKEVVTVQKQLMVKLANSNRPGQMENSTTPDADASPSVPEGGPPHTLVPYFKTLNDGTLCDHETKKGPCAYCKTVVRSVCNTCQVPFCNSLMRPPKFCHYLAHQDPQALEVMVAAWRVRSGWNQNKKKRKFKTIGDTAS